MSDRKDGGFVTGGYALPKPPAKSHRKTEPTPATAPTTEDADATEEMDR